MKKLLVILATLCLLCTALFALSACGDDSEGNGGETPHEHNYAKEVTEPNCTEQGYTTYTCSCGNSYIGDYVEALGHTEVVDEAVAPTCTETGLTEGKHCSVCEEVLIAQTVVDALGHTEVVDEAKAPTCTETGLTAGKHCSVCNEVLEAQTVVDALGHTEVIDEAVEPTCTETGLTEGKHCSVCNEVLEAQTTVNALGHTEVIDDAVAPTCTETGLTEGKHCSVCEAILEAQSVVDALGHTEGAVVVENNITPDCVNTGSYENVVYCTVCSAELSREKITVPPLGHTEVIDEAKAPTCTETGLTEGKHCSVCNETLVAQTIVPATGHTEGAVVVENNIAPDCVNAGSYENVVYCTVCASELSREKITVPALGHAEVIDEAKAPTCTESGLTAGKHCSVCEAILEAQTVVDALGHIEGAVVVENNIAPDCVNAGSYDNVVYCTVCSAELSREKITVPALGHTEVIDEAKAPTCTETGLTAGKHCSVCNETLVAQTVVPAIGHKYGSAVTEPTCTEKGYTTYTCSTCGDTYKDDEVAALGHKYGSAVTEPTCTEKGYTTYTCSACGNTYKDDEVAALGHTEVIDPQINPTCTTAGYTKGSHCSVCESVIIPQIEIEAQGHRYITSTTAPNCTDRGYTTYTCFCGDTYKDDYVDALGHTAVIDDAVAPTCTKTGLTAGKHCSVCEAVIEEQKVVDMLGHVAGSPVRENEISATCTKEGSYYEVVYCALCSLELSREAKIIDKVGHTASAATIENMVFPTCAKEGSFDEVVKCSVCGVEISRTTKLIDKTTNHTPYATKENEVASTCAKAGSYDEVVCCYVCGVEISRKTVTVAALPHTVVIDEAKAPTCTETGLTAGKHCLVCGEVLEAQSIVDALGHTEVVDEAVAPSCTETGLTAGKHCSVCGEVLEAQTVVDALGHDYESKITPPTATENVITKTYTCTICNSSYNEELIVNNFTVTSSNRAEIGYTGASGENLVIPSIFQSGDKWYYVTSIGYDAFYKCTGLTSVVIPDSVTSIGSYAFEYCTGLTSVTIPDSVTSIGNYAFRGCTSLTSVTIPDGVTSIGGSAFRGCTGLTSVVIPDSVTSIGDYAFGACTGLTSMTVSDRNTEYKSVDGNLYTKDGKTLIQYATGKTDKSFVIPNGVTSIGYPAFRDCTGLTSVVIPNGVTSIGDWVFSGCTGLESVTIPDSVTGIGPSAFSGCTGLTSVYITDLAAWCNIWFDVSSSNPLYYAKNLYLNGELVTDLVIPEGVTSISHYAFEYCSSLTSVTIPDSVTSIGEGAFSGCSGLTSVYITDLAAWCKIWFISSSSNPLCYAGNLYLDGELVTNLVIPDGVTSIGDYAFGGCTGLTSVTIPDSVTSIGNYAFRGCTGLTSITVGEGNAKYSSIDGNLYSKDGKTLIQYATGKTDTSFTIPEGVTSIEPDAFRDCDNLTSVTIPNSVTSIGNYAFENCTGLTSVVIGNGVTSIGERVFYDCTSLTSVTIGNGVTSIGEEAFYNCTGLTSVVIPDSVISIGGSAFSGCTGLTSVVIGNGVTSIGDDAFYECTSLTSVTIGNGVTSIGYGAFDYCYKLVEVINHSSLNIKAGSSNYGYVGYYAIEVHTGESKIVNYNDYLFYTYNGVNYLLGYVGEDKALVLPESYNGENYEIYKRAFYHRDDITSVVIPDSVTSIGSSAFYGCYKLVEVINHSSLNITKGSFSNGYVGYYAIEVHKEVAKGVANHGNYLFYTYNGVNYLLGYVGDDKALVLPESYNGENYEIYQYAFYNRDDITSVVIPDSVCGLGDYAFSSCDSLTSVTIPDSVTSIGDYAFQNCNSLTSVIIPNSVTSIGSSAFRDCDSLTIYCEAASKPSGWNSTWNYSDRPVVWGHNNITSNSEYDYIVHNGKATLTKYKGNATEITIPSKIDGYEVVSFGAIFSGNTNIRSITIPDSVTSIGKDAFEGCTGLTSVIIGNGVTSIGDDAFYECTGLTSVTIPDSVTSIGSYAFYNCDSLTSVTIGNSVTSIGNYAFSNCTGLTSVTIGNSVTSIGDYAFRNCTGLTSITIPDSVWGLGDRAFQYCYKLVEVINHSSLDIQAGSSSNGYVGYYAKEVHTGESKIVNYNDYLFYTYNGVNYLLGYVGEDTSLVLPESHNGENYEIYNRAFYNRYDITSVAIPDSVTGIGEFAFCGCTGLTSVTIGNGVTSIGGRAFEGCTALTSVTIPDSVTSISASSFGNTAFYNDSSNWENEALYIGAYLIDVKKTISGHYTIKDGTLIIANGAFYYCTGLTSVTIPDSVTAINGVPFESCTSLTNIIVTDGNTAYKSIDGNLYTKDGKTLIQYALGKTDTSFVIPDGVTIIARWAFAWCESLTSVTIGNSVTSIGDDAFSWCKGLTSVTIPDSVTSIGNYAFYNCSSLTSVTIPDSVTSIGAYAFSGCTSLIIYCEAESQPSGWNSNWNPSNRPVVWGDGSHTHIPADAVLENQVNATCTVDGHYDSVVYCKICNYEMSRTQIIVPMSHNYIDGICVICGELIPQTNTFEDYTEGNYIFDDMAVTKVNHIIYGANAQGNTQIVVDENGNKYFQMNKTVGASSSAQTWIVVERTLEVTAGTPVVFEAKMCISFTKGSAAYLRFYKDRPASTGTGGTCAGVTSNGTPTNNGTVMFNYHNGTLHLDHNSREGYAEIDLGVADGEWFTLRLVMSGTTIVVYLADENGTFVEMGKIERPEWTFDLTECNSIVYMNDSGTTLSVGMDDVCFGPYVSDAGDTLL